MNVNSPNFARPHDHNDREFSHHAAKSPRKIGEFCIKNRVLRAQCKIQSLTGELFEGLTNSALHFALSYQLKITCYAVAS
jgi:hypothetical protein